MAQLQQLANLHGFAITVEHRLLGMRNLKRLLRRLQYQVFARQSAFNDAARRVLQQLVADRSAVGSHAEALRRAQERIAGLERELANLRADSSTMRDHLEQLEAMRDSLPGEADHELESLDYVSLAARFRGDQQEIADRQRRYVEIFSGQSNVLDIGCGRGEFLSLLRDAKIDAQGVDIDPAMVELCHVNGLSATHGDALSHLARARDGSFGGIFAAQLIEHLAPGRSVQLVRLMHSKLRPGGVIVIETVNPESLVALSHFYLDPTHVRPIHPLTLEWLAQTVGFVDVELIYLSPVEDGTRLRELPNGTAVSESTTQFNNAIAATNNVLYGPRDYALVAHRH